MARTPRLPTVGDPFMRTRVLGFAAVCGCGLSALALLAAAAAIPTLAALSSERAAVTQVLLAALHLVITSGVLGMCLHAMLRSLPDAPPSSHATQIGAASSAAPMALATLALGLQLSRSTIVSPLDLAGNAVACVLWACVCMQCVLFAGALSAAIDVARSPRKLIAIQPTRAPLPQRPSIALAAPLSIAAARSRRASRSGPTAPAGPCVVLRFPDRQAQRRS